MKSIKLLIIPLALLIILFSGSCKKVPYYGISDGMKAYFLYKPGSYWIYKNDSTGSLDSAYVKDYIHINDGKQTNGVRVEAIDMFINSMFLSEFLISYKSCSGPDYFVLYSILKPLQTEASGASAVAFYPGWPANQTISTNGCDSYGFFYYTMLPEMTVNSKTYNTIIFSKNQTLDSIPTDPYFFVRSVYFARNIGIIKYIENDNYYKVHRSYSLLRYKVIQ